MKKRVLSVTVVFVTTAILFLGLESCKSSKGIQQPPGEVEVIIPCSGPEYFSTNKAFRYSAIGESMDMMTAKKKAMSEARAGLAAEINTTIKTVTDNYVKSGNYNNKEELMNNYEGMTREVVNQTISGTVVICEKSTQTTTGNYKYYVCIELGSNDILETISQRASANEMLKVDYNYEKFKKTFEEEMNKMGN